MGTGRSIELPQGCAETSCEKQELANGSEDKIAQMLLKKILEAIYEPVFRGFSHGFRPERNCHTAVKQLNDAVMRNPVNHVVEVDIHKFFDSADHIWLLKFLKHRIVDPNILWLVRKFLKAGIMEAGKVQTSIKGTPQGGVVSPIMRELEERLSKFGLEISKEKTRKGWFMMGHNINSLN
jgi:retron-type reverse transcriptase